VILKFYPQKDYGTWVTEVGIILSSSGTKALSAPYYL
jgi:hypothetical protein